MVEVRTLKASKALEKEINIYIYSGFLRKVLTSWHARFDFSPVSASCGVFLFCFGVVFFPPTALKSLVSRRQIFASCFPLHIRQTPEFGAKTSTAWSPSSVSRTRGAAGLGCRPPDGTRRPRSERCGWTSASSCPEEMTWGRVSSSGREYWVWCRSKSGYSWKKAARPFPSS